MSKMKNAESITAAGLEPANQSETQALRKTVELLDALAQEGFLEVAALAQLALTQLESPDAYGSMEDIARALTAIRTKAIDVENCIGVEAERVDCSHVDEARRRRADALRAWRDSLGRATP